MVHSNAPPCIGSPITEGVGSPSVVGLGIMSTQQGGVGLDSGLEVVSSLGPVVNFKLLFTSTLST